MSGGSRHDTGGFWLASLLSVSGLAVNFASEAATATEAGSQTVWPTLTTEDLHVFVDGFIAKQLASSGIPGAVVVVVKDGRVMLSEGYGLADIGLHRPMTADHSLMNIASIKKLFEGIAIMQLVEAGRLDLDRDVSAYLDFSIPTPAGGVPVTLRRLMTHRAGFEDRFKNSKRSFAELLPLRLFPYGDVPAYSNYGASLSGYILARASGKTTSEEVTDHVLVPLGMASSNFAIQLPVALTPFMAKGYRLEPGSPPARLDEYFTDLQLNTTGDDMGRFIRAVLNGGELDGRHILRPQTLATMMTPQVAEPLSVMGLYFYQREVAEVRFIGHRGDTSAFQSDLLFQPQAGFGLYVAYNAESDGNPRDDLEQALVERYFTAPVHPEPVFAPRPSDAAAVAGWYERTRRADSNLFSIEELFNQRRIKANLDGSITTGNAGWSLERPASVIRREIAPFIFQDPSGDRWAFETKHGGLEILENTDGTSGRERVPWYRTADFVQPLMAAGFAILMLALLAWPGAVLLRIAGVMRPSDHHGIRYRAPLVRLVLCIDIAVAAAVTFLLQADWDKRQIFVDGLDPWLIALYIAAWLGVLATPLVVWIAYRSWQESGTPLWTRIHYTLVATAMMTAAWIAIEWRIAGTTLNY
jgi:CubicO group peptidase (beta-lactamase class C family)